MTLIRIVAPHFVAGVVIDGNCLIRLAPIVHYMHSWSASRAKEYCEQKGWAWEVLSSL